MQNLSPRHVKIEESLRLGVVSGWYSTKVSGTFVSGPHDSEADCLLKIAEIDPPPAPSGAKLVNLDTDDNVAPAVVIPQKTPKFNPKTAPIAIGRKVDPVRRVCPL